MPIPGGEITTSEIWTEPQQEVLPEVVQEEEVKEEE
jgi:hypothetical protein